MPRDTYDLFQDPERGRFGDNEQREQYRDEYRGPGQDIHRKIKGRLVDLALIWHRETDQAVLLSNTGDPSRGVWLPKSLVVNIVWRGEPYRDKKGNPGRGCDVTLFEWKAKQAGLI
jgi:hypothetical protein